VRCRHARDQLPEVWQLRIAQASLRSPAQRDKLQAALMALLGYPVQLEIDSSAALDTPAQRASALHQQRQKQAEEAIHNDPLVRSLMQQFKTARIVPGSIKWSHP
jgi:DNA polymerase III subunit gamma/tau